MKKLYLLLSVLFLNITIILCQGYGHPKYSMGFGGGVGKGGPNISMCMTMELQEKNKFFMNFGTTGGILNNQNENNTYHFNENLFDDETRGTLETYVWITFGYVIPLKNLEFHLGGGLSGYDKYYEKYDSSEILSSSGTYYVYDEESGGLNTFTPSLGVVLNPNEDKQTNTGVFRLEGIGFSIITFPFQPSFMIWYGF